MPYVPLRRGAGRLFDENLNRMLRELYANMDITQAENVVFSTYGDRVSVERKAKNLNKFGRNNNVDTGQKVTVEEFLGATQYEETYVFADTINSIVSSSASDTQNFSLECQSIDGSGNLTFFVQTGTLTGTTPVTLTTPASRVSRFKIVGAGTVGTVPTPLVGNVSVYRSADTTITAGVPNTPAGVNLYCTAGRTQSQKCSTSISSNDYFFIAQAEFSVTGTGPASDVDFFIEVRDVANGGAFLPLGAEVSMNDTSLPAFAISFRPFLIVPKNHDVRLMCRASSNNTLVSGEFNGYLAKII